MLDKFINSNTLGARLARTIFQNALGLLVANVALLCGFLTQDPQLTALISSAVVCVASPIMALLKNKNPEEGIIETE